jgi:hypothetical protein
MPFGAFTGGGDTAPAATIVAASHAAPATVRHMPLIRIIASIRLLRAC